VAVLAERAVNSAMELRRCWIGAPGPMGPSIASFRSNCCLVDEGDIPPINAWFYLKRDYYHSEHWCSQSLFCWISKAFEKVMLAAADVEMFDSYRWLDENDMDIYYRIARGYQKYKHFWDCSYFFK
jgi:hypothetical protein